VDTCRQQIDDTYIDHLSFADGRPIVSLHQVPQRRAFALLHVLHVTRKLFHLLRVGVEVFEKGQFGVKCYIVRCLVLPKSFRPFLRRLDELVGRRCGRAGHENRPVVESRVCDQQRRRRGV